MASEVSTQEVGTPEIAVFLKLLGDLAAHQSTTFIEKALKEHKEMKNTLEATLKQKEEEYDTFARVMAKLKNDLDREVETAKNAVAESESAKAKAGELTNEIDGAKKTIAEKCQELEQGASTITGLQGNVEALQKDVQTRDEVIKNHEKRQAKDGTFIKELEAALGATKNELATTSNQLKELQDLSCQVVDGSKEFVLAEINRIYGYAQNVAFKYFQEDLSADILEDTHLFDGTAKWVWPIPLPASNSIPAKKARTAAFLAALGSRLYYQIFVPFYFLPDENQELPQGVDTVTIMLSNLSRTDPKRELHIRSVLLAISPEEQKKVAYKRANDIAFDVCNNLGDLVLEEQHEEFYHNVRGLCRHAVDSWDRLRTLKEMVESFMESPEDTEKYWLPAELEGGQAQKPQTDGKPNGLVTKPSMHSLKSAKGIHVVWPGFSYGNEVLKQGFMLLDSQVERANEEVRPSKRGMRLMQRASTGPLGQSQRRYVARKTKFTRTSTSTSD
ncbi:hypothetical protein GGR55DRAFT_480895 [Xylaria sp. FL0064]|nr:hypothetical protein GGR55DRAFT_480895 [Xylaria sp. FL0064]